MLRALLRRTTLVAIGLLTTALASTALGQVAEPTQPARPVPYPVFSTPAFDWAVQKGTRTFTGEPGPNYWTNRATYDIDAVLSPSANTLSGRATIKYFNNSPDTLRRVVLHVRQNLHKEGAVRNRMQEVTGGANITMVTFDGRPLVEQSSMRSVGYALLGTVMGVTPGTPIPPGGDATIEVAWNFQVPESGAPRMGQDGEVYYLAYWYPQVGVYDDISGWTTDQYMGNGEFYMGYADYDVSITLPDKWLVAATGALQNAESILTDQSLERLQKATRDDDIVNVVTEEDRGAGAALRQGLGGSHTWHFRADNVRDFAFGTSMSYLWDATRANVGDRDGDGRDDYATINAFYRPETPSWNRSAEFARFSIEHLSEMIFPYPYPHMTTVEGIIGGGMEFPMITLIGGARSDNSLFGVTYHEISHMWFPMIVGQNEKAFTWMDEGLTSFNTNEGRAEFFEVDAWDPKWQSYYQIAGTGNEVEPMRHGDQYPAFFFRTGDRIV